MSTLGKVCVIANPVAQNGACAKIAERISARLAEELGAADCELVFTDFAGHATEIAAERAEHAGTVVVIGGDGAVHETANGLMRVDPAHRPKMAVVPVGSGNDYALTLGMSSDPDKALKQILWCDTEMMDVGCANGEFFVETLSFGLDAAIALATVEARKKTGRKGTMLYLESGIDQLLHHLTSYEFEATLCLPDAHEVAKDDAKALRLDRTYADGVCRIITGETFLFAVQIGKTYGGHFRICPDADPTDGLFDICIAYPPISAPKALALFLSARFGKHTRAKIFEFARAQHLTIDFEEEVPCQIDGEALVSSKFDITMIPRSLEAIVGSKKGWE